MTVSPIEALAAIAVSLSILHIAVRIAGLSDDPRDAAFAREWGVASPRKMFMFLQNQGFGSIPLVFAIFVAARFPQLGLRIQDGSRRVDRVCRHRRRSAGRRATEEFPHRFREQGPGLRRRAVALARRALSPLPVAHQHVLSAATATGVVT